MERRDFLKLARNAVVATTVVATVETSVPAVVLEAVSPPKEHKFGNPKVIDFTKMSEGPLNPNEWNFAEGVEEAGWNNEKENNTSREENVRIEKNEDGDNVLVIEARVETYGEGDNQRKYTSARIDTLGHMEMQYGIIEFEAIMPSGVGTWPAMWLLAVKSVDSTVTNENDPFYYDHKEIDVAETTGALGDTMTSTIHTYNTLTSVDKTQNTVSTEVDGMSKQFHKYGIKWTPESVAFMIDGVVTLEFKKKKNATKADWPFDEKFYLILNLAIGGDMAVEAAQEKGINFPDGIDDKSSDGWKMKVKRIEYSEMIS